MQIPLILYLASILGAVALYLMMPRRGRSLKTVGMLLGTATLGGLWLLLAKRLPAELGIETSAFTFQYIFSFIAIVAAARVITHTRPIYSALWFILVILASAGLFLTLSAQFMAFAMIIIYGGAILVTYMFVLMLATQAGDPAEERAIPDYDRVAREPLAAIAAGFLLLAVLLTIAFDPMQPNEEARGVSDQALIGLVLADRAPQQLANRLPNETFAIDSVPGGETETLTNVEHIGLDLFTSHPLGLELAGVILLVALVGAVVIARTQVPRESDVSTPN
jgi:NADH-quinone oxidoreductase subunit J